MGMKLSRSGENYRQNPIAALRDKSEPKPFFCKRKDPDSTRSLRTFSDNSTRIPPRAAVLTWANLYESEKRRREEGGRTNGLPLTEYGNPRSPTSAKRADTQFFYKLVKVGELHTRKKNVCCHF